MEETVNLQKAFGEQLEKLGHKYKSLVVLDNDLSNGLNTLKFAKLFPDRHHSVPLSDLSMINMASGFAADKKIPFVCGKGITLLGRGFEAVRNNLAAGQLNVKLIASNCGLASSENGFQDCMLEDLSILQTLPDINIFSPTDPFELRDMLEEMISKFGIYYLRLHKAPFPTLFDQNHKFNSEKAEVIKSGDDICIFATGPSVFSAITAASELEKRGTSVQVVNVSCLAPLDFETIDACAANFNLLVSIEEHNRFGGLGSAIGTRLLNTNPKKLLILGTKHLNFSGKYEDALEKQSLNSKHIYEAIKTAWINN